MPYVNTTTAFIRKAPDGAKIQQLLWGDFVRREQGKQGAWVEVYARKKKGWLRAEELRDDALLEVCFVDIGQGDGTLVVVPKDGDRPERFLLVDAGEGDNMARFLSWRFNLRKHPERVIPVDAAVITHPDQDHYKGFQGLFGSPQFRFSRVFHNGIVEREGKDGLGPRIKVGGVDCVTDLCVDSGAARRVVHNPAAVGKKQYPALLRKALGAAKPPEVRMLSSSDGCVPGYEGGKAVIRVLGPVLEQPPPAAPALRWIKDDGKTKNGHSVVLRLEYGKVRILLGGDLNIPAETYLLERHTGKPVEATEGFLAAARKVFECDVAKACHHGSGDFTPSFLRAVNAVATVISSGDDEPHCHPRPDALGAIGKASRGDRPLIFSTELARSTRETIRSGPALRKEITTLSKAARDAKGVKKREAAERALGKAVAKIERSVAVYGMITLRTDGTSVLMAQKLERPREATREEFDVHLLQPDATGVLAYKSKYEAK